MVSARFWGAYWITLRPYLMSVSGVSGAAGLALVQDLPWPHFAVLFLAFFFSYGFGQALTDVFQIDTDALSSPYRPLTQGRLSRTAVAAVSGTGLTLCGLVLAIGNPWNLLLSAAAVMGLLAYTPAKRRWWAGPFCNAAVVALLPIMGALCGKADSASRPLAAAVFFSYAIFVLLGYFKDISADRATGYRTLPVSAGRRVSILASAGLLCSTAAASFAFVKALPAPAPVGAGLMVLGLAVLCAAHIAMWNISSEKEAHRAISPVVVGYLVLHAGHAVAARPALLVPALAFLAAAIWMLARRPEPSQV
jgi:4-hydroxybenzoate polyprenyltransferase